MSPPNHGRMTDAQRQEVVAKASELNRLLGRVAQTDMNEDAELYTTVWNLGRRCDGMTLPHLTWSAR